MIDCSGPAYDRFLQPLLLAALNTDPKEGSAALAGAHHPRDAAARRQGVPPADRARRLEPCADRAGAAFLETRNAPRCASASGCARSTLADGKVAALDFGDETRRARRSAIASSSRFRRGRGDRSCPTCTAPTAFRAIVNAHFRLDPPADLPPMIGVLNATIEWLFAFPGRLSATISGADRLLDQSREELAATIWREVAQSPDLPAELPPWQIVRERRATFAATPEENAKRPGAATKFSNLYLAGDWTDTGLPATIEGAIRSGNRAADLALAHDPEVGTDFGSDHAHNDDDRYDPSPAAALNKLDPALEQHIRAATDALLAEQQPDGHWVFELEADATIPAEYVLMVHYFAETPNLELERKIGVYLRRIQGAHGGWPLFHEGDFDMSASVKAYFALKMIGDDIDARSHEARARSDPVARRRA